MAEGDDKAVTETARSDAAAKLDAIRDSLTRLHGRMDSYEAEAKDRKDAEEKKRSRFDAARKDRFSKRHDGESFKDWKKRHDADEAAMCDAMRKDGAEDGESMTDAKRARHDAEAKERREDESFDEWAKEEKDEPEHKDEKKEDKAKKDGTDGKEEAPDGKEKEVVEKEDRKDSAVEVDGLKARLAEMERLFRGITAEAPAAERDALAQAQSRHDAVAAMFGDRAPPPSPGETSLAYRRRLAGRLQRHSPRFEKASFAALDSASLGAVEDIVYADAVAASRAPAQESAGTLIEEVRREGGRDVTRFHGDPMAWMQHFSTGAQVGRFNRNPKGA
jgi:hypothetical protein